MDKSRSKFEVQVNGKRIAAATVSTSDQVEINLVSLAGDNDAVLAVTAFLPDAPKRDHFVYTRNTTVSPGDTVTITLEDVRSVPKTAIESVAVDPDEEAFPGNALKCSFCGKSQHEVRKVVAGPNVIICDECVALCHDIVSNGPK